MTSNNNKNVYPLINATAEDKPDNSTRRLIYEIIFESDTPSGKLFDVLLMVAILLSVLAVLLESVLSIRQDYGEILYIVEWIFTALFSVEYLLRLISVRKPHRYAFSFFGIIDIMATLPTYLGLIFAGAHSLLVLRIFRLLRVFRVFKLTRYLFEASVLMVALKNSRHKITVFLGTVISIATAMGSFMYLIEGPENGFTSIPRGIYWAIVTLTTVGYGDIAPHTVAGQMLASFVMILGYGIIAVPTGIVTVEMAQVSKMQMVDMACKKCGAENHLKDSKYCRNCGVPIENP